MVKENLEMIREKAFISFTSLPYHSSFLQGGPEYTVCTDVETLVKWGFV